MRFHFGFSKRISIKDLITLLGALFVGLVAFFGLSQIAYADSENVVSGFRWCNYVSNTNYGFIRFTKPSREITDNMSMTSESTFKYGCSRSDTDYAWSSFNNTKPNILYSIQDNNYNSSYDVFSSASMSVNVSNLCANYNNTNSIDFFIPFHSDSVNDFNSRLFNSPFSNHYGQITEIGDMIDFTIRPLYSDITGLERECYISSNGNDSNEYDLNCLGVPYDSNIIGYQIMLYNKYYYNFQNKSNVFYLNNNNSRALSSEILFSKTIDFQCSYVAPQPTDNSVGESNIDFEELENGGFSSTITDDTIDTSFFNIAYPNTFTQFLEFPLYLASAIVNNRNHCQPININFSSITQKWGNFNYVLQLPCLSSTIQSVFGVKVIGNTTLYTIIDMFIAFYLLYQLAMRCIILIDMMMSGQDMTGFLFSGTDDGVIHYSDTYNVDSETGEVHKSTSGKMGKRRY